MTYIATAVNGRECWLLVRQPPILTDKIRAGFRRMDADLKLILLRQEQRCRGARKRK